MSNSNELTPAQIAASDPFRGDDVNLQWHDVSVPPSDVSFVDPRFTKLDSPTRSLAQQMAEFFSRPGNDDNEIRAAVGAEVDSGEVHVDGQKVLWSRKGGSYQARFNGMRYVADSKDALFSMLAKATAKPWRELNDSEALHVARLAASQNIGPAIQLYLSLALKPGVTPEQAIRDSRYAKLCDQCAWFVFENATPDYSPSEQATRFILDYCGNRPLNVGLLQVAWRAYSRADMLGHIRPEFGSQNEAPTRADLENLSDAEFEELRLAVLRERAASGRR